MNFDEALQKLSSLASRGWRPGLDRIRAYLDLAGLGQSLGPQNPGYLHIAGTNGKGSTTAYTQSLLISQGYRTGGYFSPYVYDPMERVQFQGQPMSRDDFARITSDLWEIAKILDGSELGGPTEFEFKTAIGFRYWQEMQCDYVALEVGLGGRLDATNVVSPVACSIVSIGLDHTAILGDTLPEIAREKAGIIKAGVPAIAGQMDQSAMGAIVDQAMRMEAPLWRIGEEVLVNAGPDGYEISTPRYTFRGIKPGIKGKLQGENAAIAIAMLDAAHLIRDPSAIARAIESTRIPGRYERREVSGQTWILDGAHNAAAAEALADTLTGDLGEKRLVLISNMLEGHDLQSFYGPLKHFIKEIWVVPINFFRARPIQQTCQELQALGFHCREFQSIPDAINEAQKTAETTILVTGSFYLVGELGNCLGS